MDDIIKNKIDTDLQNWSGNTWIRPATIVIISGHYSEITSLYKFLVEQSSALSPSKSDTIEDGLITVEDFAKLAADVAHRLFLIGFHYCLAGNIMPLENMEDLKKFDVSNLPKNVQSVLKAACTPILVHLSTGASQLAYLWCKQNGKEHLRNEVFNKHSNVNLDELNRITRGCSSEGVLAATLRVKNIDWSEFAKIGK